MAGFNLPPGCSVSSIPGNRSQDADWERVAERMMESDIEVLDVLENLLRHYKTECKRNPRVSQDEAAVRCLVKRRTEKLLSFLKTGKE